MRTIPFLLLITFAVPAVMAGPFDSPALAGSGLPVAAYVVGFLFSVVQSQRASVSLVEAR